MQHNPLPLSLRHEGIEPDRGGQQVASDHFGLVNEPVF